MPYQSQFEKLYLSIQSHRFLIILCLRACSKNKNPIHLVEILTIINCMRFFPKNSRSTFFCFSPAVMLFTLLTEFLFAIYVILTSRRWRPSTFLIVALLVCLGIFQLAEFQVCGGARTVAWMRVGYVGITLLPALGLHLVSLVTKHRRIKYIPEFSVSVS